ASAKKKRASRTSAKGGVVTLADITVFGAPIVPPRSEPRGRRKRPVAAGLRAVPATPRLPTSGVRRERGRQTSDRGAAGARSGRTRRLGQSHPGPVDQVRGRDRRRRTTPHKRQEVTSSR